MPTGTIARLLIDKGFGFIRDESGIEHFFHRSAVRGAVFELLREGQRVEFSSRGISEGTARGRHSPDRRIRPYVPPGPPKAGSVSRAPRQDSARIFPALGPFCDGSSSKLTRCPSLSCSNAPASTDVRWKNHS